MRGGVSGFGLQARPRASLSIAVWSVPNLHRPAECSHSSERYSDYCRTHLAAAAVPLLSRSLARAAAPSARVPGSQARRKGHTIYVHVLSWPGDSITLPNLTKKILSSSLLTGGGSRSIRRNKGSCCLCPRRTGRTLTPSSSSSSMVPPWTFPPGEESLRRVAEPRRRLRVVSPLSREERVLEPSAKTQPFNS